MCIREQSGSDAVSDLILLHLFSDELLIQVSVLQRPEMSSVCVLRSVFAFCVLRHVRRKKNVRRRGKQGI